ncbi:beta-glucosidase [Gemmatimonadetes bacterium T265]|nr:beta-glucosidase [Gemmatimonadetes bacterium T265]
MTARATALTLGLSALALGAPAARAQERPVTPARADRIADSVLALLSLDEKVGQLIQMPGGRDQTGPTVPAGGEDAVRTGRIGSFLSFWGADATRRMQRAAVEQSPHHVPLLFALDVIHGFRTIFPEPLGEAASFDPATAERDARAAAVEASAAGIHWTFAPMVDIARDPRWGRVVEGAGEDPYLGARFAEARVRGFQGDSGFTAPTALLATAKHFVGYGASEGGRDYNTGEIGERTLWDVYLPPFEAAERAGVATFMAGFSAVDGTPPHANRWLLTDVLRDRWHFGGLVVSDWEGIRELMPHGIAATRADAALRAVTAGVDVDMSDNVYGTDLAALVRAGRVPQAAVDSAARRVLRAKALLGLFDDPYHGVTAERERRDVLAPAHRALARASGRASVVLLENRDNTLPLSKAVRSLAVIGPLADDRRSSLGNWLLAAEDRDAVTVLAGLRAALPGARVSYLAGVPADTVDARVGPGIDSAVALARAADATVLVLGEREYMSAEASSRSTLDLPGAQLALAQAVVRAARAAGKPAAVVLMNGRPLSTPWLADSAGALVESWFLGVEHGNAVADVLFGDYNPAGRLPMTVPRAVGQVPLYYNHANTGRPAVAADHFTSKYLDVPWTPLYPFGYGRSYTTFAYRALRPSADTVRFGSARDTLGVSVEVTNTGARAGDEVVQLYVRDDAARVVRPVRELKGFRRVSLRPGETRTVRFTLRAEDLAFYGLDMRRVVEPGTFTLWAGGSSAAALEAKFAVAGDTLVVAPAPPPYR